MRIAGRVWCALAVLMLLWAGASAAWRSSLYPEDWTPGYADGQGRFLHDFSYAGYRMGEAPIPDAPPGAVLSVTQAPYGADKTGAADATAAIQQALDDAGAAGGGIVYLPAGTYRVKPPAGKNEALRISRRGVVLRGAGPGATFVFNDDPQMRNKTVIRVQPSSGSWHSPLAGTTVAITADLLLPTHEIPVASTAPFAVGDWVVVRTDCTDAFIAEHGMTGKWTSSLQGVTLYRRVTAVNAANSRITIDIPTRYYMKVRDNARVYKVAPALDEAGVENLSVGMRENLTPGLGSTDYEVPGTAAYEVHRAHAVIFSHTVNSWIRNVRTYRPTVNTNNWHTVSNIFLLSMTRNVTIQGCRAERPEYEGGGGNGYGYTLRGNDNLIVDCVAYHTRHNYDFKSMWSTGNVILNCQALTGHLVSDFHMHLSAANLLDGMYVQNDSLQARYRASGTIEHGHPTSQSVFWNSYGAGGKTLLVESQQWGWGYVIGTSGPMSKVVLGTSNGSAPNDFLEGEGTGDTLEPRSLYEDQLARRLVGQSGDRAAPAQPAGLLGELENGHAHLFWQANGEGDFAGYHVYRATTPQGNFVRLTADAIPAPEFTDPSRMVWHDVYYYRVSAVDEAGNESQRSALVRVQGAEEVPVGWASWGLGGCLILVAGLTLLARRRGVGDG